jgi:hypothetical protein
MAVKTRTVAVDTTKTRRRGRPAGRRHTKNMNRRSSIFNKTGKY